MLHGHNTTDFRRISISFIETFLKVIFIVVLIDTVFFLRPDVQKEHLSDFFDYCREQIENQRAGSIVDYYKRGKKKIKKNWQHNHKLTNTLKTLAAIYRTAPRELLQEMSSMFEDVIEEIAEEVS